jgi:hypothetical protein
MDNTFEALGVAVMVLGAVALVGALIRIAIGIMRQQRAKAAAEPANSHPGRVIPPGMPIGRALREAAGDLNGPLGRPARAGAADCPGREPGKGLKFSVGQWVHHTSTGELAQLVSAGGSGWWSYRVQWGEGGCPDTAIIPAHPREGEWWQKRLCPKDHPVGNGMRWSEGQVRYCYTVGEYTNSRCGASRRCWDALFAGERDACECGCLAPVNFGLGEAPHHEPPKR